MRRSGMVLFLACLATTCGMSVAYADTVTIHDIQFNTTDGDESLYNGQTHSVTGGIVMHTWSGFNDRIYLRDPAHPTWGAIVVKDREGGELSNAVQVGDWVSFSSILIEESRGVTYLQYDRVDAPNVSFTIQSSGNPIPSPTMLTATDIPVPVNHAASEPYESMIVTLQDITIGVMDLGKADDNYELIQGSDLAWGTDYMNTEAGGLYDPRIAPGVELQSITGIVEQYTKSTSGWDYYQINTRSAADIVPEPATVSLLVTGVVALVVRRRRR